MKDGIMLYYACPACRTRRRSPGPPTDADWPVCPQCRARLDSVGDPGQLVAQAGSSDDRPSSDEETGVGSAVVIGIDELIARRVLAAERKHRSAFSPTPRHLDDDEPLAVAVALSLPRSER